MNALREARAYIAKVFDADASDQERVLVLIDDALGSLPPQPKEQREDGGLPAPPEPSREGSERDEQG
jgi:hypothetical protein